MAQKKPILKGRGGALESINGRKSGGPVADRLKDTSYISLL